MKFKDLLQEGLYTRAKALGTLGAGIASLFTIGHQLLKNQDYSGQSKEINQRRELERKRTEEEEAKYQKAREQTHSQIQKIKQSSSTQTQQDPSKQKEINYSTALDPIFIAKNILTAEEGFIDIPYLDPVGIPTIGYGFKDVKDVVPLLKNQTVLNALKNRDKKTLQSFRMSKDQANLILDKELKSLQKKVNSLIQIKLSPIREAVILSIVWNIGYGAFLNSELLKRINANDINGTIGEILKWNKAGGKVSDILKKRRANEFICYRDNSLNSVSKYKNSFKK